MAVTLSYGEEMKLVEPASSNKLGSEPPPNHSRHPPPLPFPSQDGISIAIPSYIPNPMDWNPQTTTLINVIKADHRRPTSTHKIWPSPTKQTTADNPTKISPYRVSPILGPVETPHKVYQKDSHSLSLHTCPATQKKGQRPTFA